MLSCNKNISIFKIYRKINFIVLKYLIEGFRKDLMMIGLGTIINVIAIIIGGVIGLMLKHNLKDKYKIVMIQGVGLTTIVVGMNGSIQGLIIGNDKFIFLVIILSIVIGGIIGTFIKIEERLNKLGDNMQNKFVKRSGDFSKGFVTASIIFCVGAMAIMGSMNDGMSGDYSMLTTKAIIDGITAMILASTLGVGVVFSFIPVLLYQGSITIIAYYIGEFIADSIKNQMTIVGNILIIGIGLELLEIKKIKVADMLPAVFMPIIYYIFLYLF